MTEHAPIGIAVAQFSPEADAEANLFAIRALAERAVERGASVVVFPEYSSYFSDPMGQDLVDHAEALDGTFVETLAGLAQELSVHVVAGLVERTEDASKFANTIVVLSPEAELVARYRKQHLYDAFGQKESDWVVPGALDEPELFETGGLRFGIQTCYDIRFPEVTRRIVDAGADVVLVPAEWVRGPLKEHHWRTLVTARAIENTVYLAAADHTPPIGVGNSMVIDPTGTQIAGIGIETDVAVGFASGSTIARVRAVNPALELRRFSVVPNDARDV
ncbi:carbon-nitrogen hydrolase family protein [Mycetocola manganoxydans]|uniref:Carbon-nitrogen hydrolase family protein n=1 Tax=Mycetocola manganoxydans TaxID=699879 RepID=A0A3L6ZT93_9MICO|nr:carbon-nitrogen hydrolase family protein [Mycetocola manganoxydans]RLP70771.1 carbon-nitrogen hydrolase family protein [Mycetocola manganoxydans]GHD48409.1 hydrolase [Mycetocola manganoxydans]